MPKVKVYNLNGEVVREEELAPQVFDIVIKPVVVQQVVEAQLANSRQVLAHTKGRGEVSGVTAAILLVPFLAYALRNIPLSAVPVGASAKLGKVMS